MKLRNIEETMPNHLGIVVLLKPQTVLFGYYLRLLNRKNNRHQILFYQDSGDPIVSSVSKDEATPFLTKHTFSLEEVSRLRIEQEDLLSLFTLCREGQSDLYKELCKSQIIEPYQSYLKSLEG